MPGTRAGDDATLVRRLREDPTETRPNRDAAAKRDPAHAGDAAVPHHPGHRRHGRPGLPTGRGRARPIA